MKINPYQRGFLRKVGNVGTKEEARRNVYQKACKRVVIACELRDRGGTKLEGESGLSKLTGQERIRVNSKLFKLRGNFKKMGAWKG